MTTDLFIAELNKFDADMNKQKRKVVLVIDNCSAHVNLPSFKSIKIEFLPPNTTSKLQPLDQGIIKNFKSFFRKEVVRQFLVDTELGNTSSINVLQAIRLADKAWRNITAKTIVNCFKSCGFIANDINSETERNNISENETICDEWENLNIDFEDFVSVDDEVAVCGDLSDMDIVESMSQNNDIDDDGNDEQQIVNIINEKEAKQRAIELRSFLEKYSDTSEDIFSAMHALESFIDKKIIFKKSKQPKITEYFI